jgi:deazaflavin-dependent oxidoreductase (nitroreductase family)
MKRLRVVIGGVVAAFVAASLAFVVGMRKKWPPVQDRVRRASRAMKPLVLKTAGQPGANTSIVRHAGRRSGTPYDTPVVAASTDDGFVIALPYGPTVDWVQNVVAAGRATVVFDGSEVEVDRPEVVSIAEVEHFFANREQRAHRRYSVTDALHVRTSSVDSR